MSASVAATGGEDSTLPVTDAIMTLSAPATGDHSHWVPASLGSSPHPFAEPHPTTRLGSLTANATPASAPATGSQGRPRGGLGNHWRRRLRGSHWRRKFLIRVRGSHGLRKGVAGRRKFPTHGSHWRQVRRIRSSYRYQSSLLASSDFRARGDDGWR